MNISYAIRGDRDKQHPREDAAATFVFHVRPECMRTSFRGKYLQKRFMCVCVRRRLMPTQPKHTQIHTACVCVCYRCEFNLITLRELCAFIYSLLEISIQRWRNASERSENKSHLWAPQIPGIFQSPFRLWSEEQTTEHIVGDISQNASECEFLLTLTCCWRTLRVATHTHENTHSP